MITVTINGKTVQAQPGMTIMEVADAHGIHIPRLCYHKHLSPIGACRICVVEVKPGPPRPVPACTTPVADKMEVVTESEQLLHYRRELLQLLLINHPLDCPICDKGGECELQNLTRELKIKEQPYQAVRLKPDYDDRSPLIERYPDRCVNCERCVRTCRDWVGAAAIYFDHRGYRTTVTAGGKVLDCEFCGSCIGVCPVGAIIDKTFKYSARSWQLKKDVVICPYCGSGCHLVLNTKKGRLKRVTASFEEPVNGGIICSRGRFSLNIVEREDRLTQPLVRKDGELHPVSWDEALDYAARRISEIRKEHGPKAFAGIGSPRATNESNYVFQKFCRGVLGTPHVDAATALDHQKLLRAMLEVLGRPRVTWTEEPGLPQKRILGVTGFQLALGTLEDLDRADTVLVLGSDIKKEMPIFVWRINRSQQKRRLRNLLVVSPRRTRFRSRAQWNGYCRPGSSGFVVLGILKALFEVGGEPLRALGDFRREEVLRRRLNATQWELIAETTGLSRKDLTFLAEQLLSAERPSLIVGYDLAGLADGYDAACYIADLLLVLGKKLRVHFTAEKANTQGCSDMGVSPYWLPGYVPLDEADRVQSVWKMEIPREKGMNLSRILKAAAGEVSESIQALMIMGTDLFGTTLNRERVSQALEQVPFVMSLEAFLNETAARADVVFPAKLSVETEGTLTSGELRVQRQKGVPFVDGPMADWEILSELGRRIGAPMEYTSAEGVFQEICRVFPHYEQYELGEIPPEGFWWNRLYRTKYGSTGWRRVLDPSLAAVIPWLEVPPSPTDEYPFLLMVGRSLFHSGTMTRYGRGAMTLEPTGTVRINETDAENLGIADGDRIVLTSCKGSTEAPVEVDRRVSPGTVQGLVHFDDSAINRLTDGSILVPVRVEKAAKD